MHGFYGRALKIDATARSFEIISLSEDLLLHTLGGKGLGTGLLLQENPVGADPLGPENRLIIATGPACNSRVWGGSRYGVYTKSPLTGLYAESYAGGKTPEAIDSTGFDAIIITGRADSLLSIAVHPNGCEFHAADDLRGLPARETEDGALQKCHSGKKEGKCGAMVIGPAGENQVACAVIKNDYWRSAGRCGMGAVMGAKNIKALVFSGDRKREPYDPKGLSAFFREFGTEGKEHPGTKAYKGYGTTMMVAMLNTAGAFPARYWSQGTCEHWENLSGETYHARQKVRARACPKCFMACTREAEIMHGRHKGLKLEGPEYETIFAFGGLCMIEDMEEVAFLNVLCDQLGVDTITAGNLCALAIEAGLQGRAETGVEYNDPDGCAALIKDMAAREGIGALLARGIRETARAWGMEDQAVHVKGLEPPGYDPRVLKGMGLTYATTARGACHLRTTFYKPELSGMIPPEQIEGKAEMLIDFENRLALFDALILCRFYRDMYNWDVLEELIFLLTGIKADKEKLQHMGAHIVDMTRRFNLREGMDPSEDRLPQKLTRQALPSGHRLEEEEMKEMISDYYHLRGWDEKGRPGE